jgi:hypothetical protein
MFMFPQLFRTFGLPTVGFLLLTAPLIIQRPAIAQIPHSSTWNTLEENRTKPIPQNLLSVNADDLYTSPQGDYTIQMPGRITENNFNGLTSISRDTQTRYGILFVDLPVEVTLLSSQQTQQMLEEAASYAANRHGELVSMTSLTSSNYPGIEMIVEFPQGHLGKFQFISVGRRMYMLQATTFNEFTSESDAFFASFELYPDRISYRY